jgi:hypothetical protein
MSDPGSAMSVSGTPKWVKRTPPPPDLRSYAEIQENTRKALEDQRVKASQEAQARRAKVAMLEAKAAEIQKQITALEAPAPSCAVMGGKRKTRRSSRKNRKQTRRSSRKQTRRF